MNEPAPRTIDLSKITGVAFWRHWNGERFVWFCRLHPGNDVFEVGGGPAWSTHPAVPSLTFTQPAPGEGAQPAKE